MCIISAIGRSVKCALYFSETPLLVINLPRCQILEGVALWLIERRFPILGHFGGAYPLSELFNCQCQGGVWATFPDTVQGAAMVI